MIPFHPKYPSQRVHSTRPDPPEHAFANTGNAPTGSDSAFEPSDDLVRRTAPTRVTAVSRYSA